MQITKQSPNSTTIILTVALESDELEPIKQQVLKELAKNVKIAGFRPAKAPLEMVQKQVDQQVLNQEFLEEAIQKYYPEAARQEKLRPVDRPEISIKAFVPFSELSFEATVPVITDVKLPDYKKLKKPRTKAKVVAKDIDEVIDNLRAQSAEKESVERAAKTTDQVMIDFSGVDKNGKAIKGADGTDYPLVLGSKTFIPGFEENIEGLKTGDEKTFDVTFPEDYGVSSLAGEKVTFTVTVKDVKAVKKPKLDDEFASKVGPVKSVDELKSDIKKELSKEKQRQADLDYESELVRDITKKAKVDIPDVLIDEQEQRLLDEFKQNLTYRGQTIAEFLADKDMNEEEYRKNELRPQAEERVKASIVLSEIADQENIQVTPEELEIRLQVLKGQYQDAKMQEELNKPESRQNIASRMLSEKTVAQLASYADKNASKK